MSKTKDVYLIPWIQYVVLNERFYKDINKLPKFKGYSKTKRKTNPSSGEIVKYYRETLIIMEDEQSQDRQV